MKPEERKFRAENFGPRAQFTAIELEILDLTCAGMTSKEIGAEIGRAVITIDRRVVEMLKYTGQRNKLMLALWCLKTGVVPYKGPSA